MEPVKCSGLSGSNTLELGEPEICPFRGKCARYLVPVPGHGQHWIETPYRAGRCAEYLPIESETTRLAAL